jgi:hypothetical protein
MSKENPMICDNHIDINIKAKKIIKLLEPEPILDGYVNRKEIIKTLNEIVECSNSAMKQGKKMEKRLKKYHDKILSLGFERKRK